MIKNLFCVFLLITVVSYVLAGRGIEEDILSRCKHVQCRNVADLKLEANIRQCIKITCGSKHLQNLAEECQKNCIDEIKSHPENQKPDFPGESPKILDYDWLN